MVFSSYDCPQPTRTGEGHAEDAATVGSNGTIDHIGQLTPDPRNARRHTPRNVGMIESALGEVGFARSIVIDEHGTILAGNATVEAAARVGIERVKVVDVDGEELVAVRRTGLTDLQKTRLALFDNRSSELAEWEPDVLAGLTEPERVGLWTDHEMAVFLSAVDPEDFDPAAHWTGMPEFHQDDLMPVKQIAVNFASAEDVETFGRLVEQSVTMATKSLWFPLRTRRDLHGSVYAADGGDES